MIKAEDVLQALREKYHGMSHLGIAKATGVSYSYIAYLMSGKASTQSLSLKKINQLFPEASLNFGGRAIGDRNNVDGQARVQSDDTINADCNSGIVILFNYGTVNLMRDAEKKDR
jgi:predicted transcriptional regulator